MLFRANTLAASTGKRINHPRKRESVAEFERARRGIDEAITGFPSMDWRASWGWGGIRPPKSETGIPNPVYRHGTLRVPTGSQLVEWVSRAFEGRDPVFLLIGNQIRPGRIASEQPHRGNARRGGRGLVSVTLTSTGTQSRDSGQADAFEWVAAEIGGGGVAYEL